MITVMDGARMSISRVYMDVDKSRGTRDTSVRPKRVGSVEGFTRKYYEHIYVGVRELS